ncbi:non-ribosomal peptide synthetase/type I polyketide synthase [Clostridium estertheticum]|uniref:non-ribosomal peptide synthetase/type I polyketide synthase n=1 Tax=Clostridium estertheticum TaxID=238834 RepID=UPI001C6E4D34|nr:non-ribosomal peptide synthetase/type I polyketide synthase [Clostridium estertheticum]MBW9154571.1 amino acid adenylation domain-containing protein [Clostridium estertheticum]WLC83812.1 amino acid adenylation domain-containing protein [Clostridium estertheticum]
MSDIAIVGMGCRLPGSSNSPSEFWNLLANGIDGTSDVKDERWNKNIYYDKNKQIPGRLYTIHGGFIDEIDKFDPGFFGISPREAKYMDPQQRILIEVVHEALEDAGILPESLRGKKVGVYVGGFTVDYKVIAFRTENSETIDAYSSTGAMMTMLSNKISYIYDLKGPSMTLDTACSGSLVATHLACEAIKNGDCEMAIVAGVNIMINPNYTIAECKANFLSPDGRCKTFDESANGYARGEGAGVALLKPLEKAIADKNEIYSVIKSTGSNQDGHTDGIAVPNGEQQEILLKETCKKANIDPSDIGYMEAHGTGTAVGDPIEANAIGNVIKVGRENKPDCIIGSVKPNIGHLEPVSGIASLIKVSLMMGNKKIPPNINFKKANHKINFSKLRLKVSTELCDFKSPTGKLIAGVNSFGFGGSNASVILENFDKKELVKDISKKRSFNIAILTGKTENALYDVALNMKKFILNNTNNINVSIEDIAYSLLNNRSHHECKLTFPVKSKEQMIEYLDAFINKETRPDMFYEKSEFKNKKNLVFVYTGMGPIWWAMGRQLLEKEEVFRKTVEKCDEIIQGYAGWSIIKKLLANEEDSELDRPKYAQPANFVIQVALTELWHSYGIKEDAVVGHSVGEVAAAYVSGALDLKTAIKVSIERSSVQEKLVDKGTMMAVNLSEEEAKELLEYYGNKVSIGVINSNKSVTLSGNKDSLQEIEKILANRGIFAKLLSVNVAYHSCQMDVVENEFNESIKGIISNKTSVPIYSTVTGSKLDGTIYGESYWWKNIRQTVRFKDAMNELLDDGYKVFVEIGPHPVLRTSIEDCMRNKNVEGRTIPSIIRKKDEQNIFSSSLGHLYTLGYEIDKKSVNPTGGSYVKIPLYPWQNERYWNETEESLEIRTGINNNYMLGRKLKVPTPIWENGVTFTRYPYLQDHKVQNINIFPGAGYIELGLAFLKEYMPNSICKIENIEFKKAMFLKENFINHIQFVFDPQNNKYEVYSRTFEDNYKWTLNALGKITRILGRKENMTLDLETIKKEYSEEVTKEECYNQFSIRGFQYGSKFRTIQKLYRDKDSALCYLKIADDDYINEEKYVLHPTIIDGCFQGMIAIMSNFIDIADTNKLFLPTSIGSVQVSGKPQKEMISYIKITVSTPEFVKGDIVLCDRVGNVVANIDGFTISDSEVGSENNFMKQTTYDYDWYNTKSINELGYNAYKFDESEKTNFDEKGLWLIFKDENELGDELVKKLSERNQKCISIIPGDEYAILNNGESIVINANNEEDYNKLVIDLQIKYDIEIKGILHLWNLRAKYSSNMESSYLQKFQMLGCMSVVNLVKSFEINSIVAPIWIVTRNVNAVIGVITEQALPQAPVWGLGKVLAYQEYPDMFGSLIDLDVIPSKNDVENIIKQIERKDNEGFVAFRGNEKYVPRITDSKLVQNSVLSEFKSNKTYLITGAFGALGMLVAKWLCENGARRLILVSRTRIPERKEWKNINKESILGKRILFIKELEDKGINIHLATIDISDRKALNDYMNKFYEEQWPEVVGVMHCAGVVKDKLINNMDKETFNMVIKPKIEGSWNLHKEFENKKLDFFVLFSSVSSIINITMGQSNYAAANMFMDILSSYRKGKGLPCVSINWGPWSEVGMASENNMVRYYENKGIAPVTPNKGIRTLDQILSYDKSQIIVVTAKWNLMKNLFSTPPAMIAYLCERDSQLNNEESNLEVEENILEIILKIEDPNEKKIVLKEHLCLLVAKIFGYSKENLSTTKTLNELGMDSLMATDIRRNIDMVYNVKISMVELMQGINLDELFKKVYARINQEEAGGEVNSVYNIHAEPDIDKIYESFPLTDLQMAYIAGKNESFTLGGISTYMYMEIESQVNIEGFNDALNKVIDIHPMLRTVFLPDGTQKILEKVPKYSINCRNISSYSDELKEKEILKMRDELSHKCNDETKWPLFNISALKLSDKDILIFTGFDMLITDSASWQRTGEDLSKLYYHPEEFLEKSDFTFRDYVLAYEKVKFTKEYEEDKKYWLSKVDSFPKTPNLPLKVSPKSIGKPNFSRFVTKFKKEEWNRLKQLSREHSVTPSVLFCTIYSMVLSYWSNQDKLGINITVFNRLPFNQQVENLVGDFTSLLLLDVDNGKEESFWDKVKLVRDTMIEGLEHKLFDGLEVIRELSKRNGDIDSIEMPIVFTSVLSRESKQLSGWSSFGEIYTTLCQTPQVYLDNQLIEIDGELVICLDYVENLFDKNDIKNMYDKYIELVRKVIKDGDIKGVQPVESDINFINNYNCTDEEINEVTLQKLFKKQVLKSPKNIALKFKDELITYEELDRKSNCVAVYLKKQGVKRKDFIAVKGDRCIETIVNILGILKLGAAYVPLDPNYPKERIEYIVKNSGCKFIISPSLFTNVDLESYEDKNFEVYNEPNDTAYIIYTSGSTGKPKGVVISHKAVTNTILDINNKFNVSEKDRLIAISSINFDLSVYDIFGALSSGATLVIVPDLKDIDLIINIIINENITIWNSVPAIMDMLIDNVKKYDIDSEAYREIASEREPSVNQKENISLRLVMLSGDWIPLGLPGKVLDKFSNAEVISLGGATEGSIWSIYYPIKEVEESWKSIPYGKPLANQKMYILNDKLEPVPINIQGEICIGGIGVATGYDNDIEKTENSFINHPTLGHIYKTGDFGVLRKDGYIEFLGRKDSQVKIRGNRVELGEIEHCLRSMEEINNAVVVDLVDKKHNKYLCAYIVSNEELRSGKIKEYLSKHLADYMVPLKYIKIDSIPLSPNGKVDKKSLPVSTELESEYIPPRNDTEVRLQEICKNLLNVDSRISIDDNLYDLGWDSIKIILCASKIKADFCIDMPFTALLKYYTIKQLAEFIKDSSKENTNIYTILNNELDNKIFAFPPALTFGIAFNSLSRLIDNYSIYAFDYVQNDDIINIYVNEIIKIQDKEPYNLMGYSGGGSIAYEVAKELESRGYKVPNVILIDTNYGLGNHISSIGQDFRKEIEADTINVVTQKLFNGKDINGLGLNLGDRVEGYFNMVATQCSTEGHIGSNLYLVSSDKSVRDYRSFIRGNDYKWGNLTDGQFYQYQGYGAHDDMLFDDYVLKNGEIIKSILSKF